MNDIVTLTIENNVGIITLNQPETMNMMSPEMFSALSDILDKINESNEIRALLLRGNGKCFCAGGHVKYYQGSLDELIDGILIFEPMVEKLHTCKIPILASVHGAVAGGGLVLMLACDLVIASQSTKFTTAYTKLGVCGDGGITYFLPRLVGPKVAMELLLLSETFTSEYAHEIGLVNWVSSDEKFSDEAYSLVTRLANGPTLAYKHIKKQIHDTMSHSLRAQCALERRSLQALFETQDLREGVKSFFEKKEPKFMGE